MNETLDLLNDGVKPEDVVLDGMLPPECARCVGYLRDTMLSKS